ncbi:MAG: squalene/phytoene synthase family protein, partial [Armatimonadota bacterium]|nr:squalene/phytoene synthase family protein [Armatimonadota bacterium]
MPFRAWRGGYEYPFLTCTADFGRGRKNPPPERTCAYDTPIESHRLKSHLAELDHPAPDRSYTLAEADAYCAALARGHYENFTVASGLLPRRLRKHFFAVYSFCRWADDLGDELGDRQRSLDGLAWWRSELD